MCSAIDIVILQRTVNGINHLIPIIGIGIEKINIINTTNTSETKVSKIRHESKQVIVFYIKF